MTKKQEVLVYLSKQIQDKKGLVEYTKKNGNGNAMDDIFIDEWKQEISTLLNAMDLILGE